MAPPELSVYTGRSDASRPSPSRARSHSMSSDRPSVNGFGLQTPPASISPDPVFIAPSAASQIVTNDHDSHSDSWFDQHGIEPSGETALVAPPALKLVNRFLDQLLFNFLSVSRSTSLTSLRPAVSEILKPKLARDAISGADQELLEYLGDEEDEDLLALHSGHEPNGDWDLELVWKRTRLRCMVYSSLGDMEEEDEDFFAQQGHLDEPSTRFSSNSGVVSPAVAIFLTSILEFMGEQVLVVAGQAAYHRLRAKHERDERDGTSTPMEIAERVVVEEADMERVALDRTLGRLWRGWKKRVRSPTTSVSMGRSFSRESLLTPAQNSRTASLAPEEHLEEESHSPSLAAVLAEHDRAASIPLPITSQDIREIEIPGLAHQSDDDDDDDDEVLSSEDEGLIVSKRPKSMSNIAELAPSTTPETNPSVSPNSRSKKRPYSLPPSNPLPYTSPKKSKVAAENNNADAVPDATDGPVEQKSLIAGVMAGALAIGSAAVVGITAAAKGEAPQTSTSRDEDTEVEEDYFEVPRIMTSSRVSVSGGISPNESTAPSRRNSGRSHSIHSLRLIEVTSPRSPGGSRSTSLEARPISLHSPLLIDTQGRGISPIRRTMSGSPLSRNSSGISTRRQRNSAEDSITEEGEKEVEDESPPMTAVPSDLAAAMSGVDFYPSPTTQSFGEEAPLAREPISREITPKAKAFVLASAPPARNAARLANISNNAQTMNGNHSQIHGHNMVMGTKHMEANGAPPLTPLRELVEGAPDTSDTGSSHDAHSVASTSTASLAQRDRLIRPQPNGLRSSPPEEYYRKDSIPKSHRPTHTSGSSSSSVSHKLKATRTSEDAPRGEGKGQSFEQLIRSDQTIQYTLTPQNMRKIEAVESQRNGQQVTHDVPRPSTSRSHSSSVSKHVGLTKSFSTEPPKSAKSSHSGGTTPRPTPNTGARLRPNAPQPRDARVDRESIGDFAEFIKSTGPANFDGKPPRTAPPVNGHRGTNSLSSRNGPEARIPTANSLPRRAESSAGRNRLQARDAVVPRGDSISDLIDFVRSGPQLDHDSHRIPRTVAPFRTTMDSDQMTGAVGGRAIDASLPDPRHSQTTPSVDSSVTSQSALLSSSRMNKSQNRMNDFDEEEDMIPKRKQRRVRDMYQIDFSDEEEEYEVLSSGRRPPPEEESLADFLRNVPPPPDSAPAPLYAEAPSSNTKKLKKKASSSGLISRFVRSNTAPQPPPKSKSYAPPATQPRATSSRGHPQTQTTHFPLTNEPDVPQKPSPYSSPSGGPEPSRSNYVSQVDSARSKVSQKGYQSRELTYRSQTSDLADFLRNEPPPSSREPQPFKQPQKEEASTFQRMFGRKKVH